MARPSVRFDTESSRLALAFVISLALHLLLFGTYETGKKLQWWQHWHSPTWVQRPKMLTQLLNKKQAQAQKNKEKEQQEVPLLFVDVSPVQETTEPPKDAKFYSSRNSQAANPEVGKEADIPKITGTQERVVKTEDVPRQKVFTPLQPALPAPVTPKPQEAVKARPAMTPGDLTMAKPGDAVRKDEGQAPRPRPRTIAEALARKSPSIPGEKMKQEGGVKRHLEIASLDAKATPFGAYDAALVEAIAQRWYSLLDQRDYASDAQGKVVLQFQLHYDGRITDVAIAQNTAGDMLGLICEKAVRDPSPYAAWPTEMRRMMGETRNIQFTFYYN